jgi:broad specificity phosphatase PhoE
MKILFVRHGESTDDLTDQFGGWADFEITEKGKEQIAVTAEKIANLNIPFEYIYTSNLKRASDSAKVIGARLGLAVEDFVYLKERNTYGLLTGMVKAEAKAKYPDLYRDYDEGHVMGSESSEALAERIKVALSLLTQKPYENIIAMTHSKLFIGMFALLLGLKLDKTELCSFFVLDFKADGQVELVLSEGIEYSKL